MMKRQITKYFLLFFLLLDSVCGWGQAKIYTRKARLADFQTKITKVVLSGNPILDASLKEEISSRWRISPFEFCNVADYEALKDKTLYYFLRLASDRDFCYLILTKGGPLEDNDTRKERFDVVSLPVSSAGMAFGRELLYFSAFIDIIQDFMERALISDNAAYRGVKTSRIPAGKTILLDAAAADSAFVAGRPDTISGLVIPSTLRDGRGACYKMLISTDDHRLHYLGKGKVRSEADLDFSAKERRTFSKKGE